MSRSGSIDRPISALLIVPDRVPATRTETIPDAPAAKPEHLGTLHTLRDIVNFLDGPQASANIATATPQAAAVAPVAALAVTALSLGEVGASARVETPSWESYAKLIFDRMHYGSDSTVAALSLLMLGSIAVAAVVMLLIRLFAMPRGSAQRPPDPLLPRS